MKPDYYLVLGMFVTALKINYAFNVTSCPFLGFAEGGSLYNLLHKQHYYPDFAQTLKWAKEIAEGVCIVNDLLIPNLCIHQCLHCMNN